MLVDCGWLQYFSSGSSSVERNIDMIFEGKSTEYRVSGVAPVRKDSSLFIVFHFFVPRRCVKVVISYSYRSSRYQCIFLFVYIFLNCFFFPAIVSLSLRNVCLLFYCRSARQKKKKTENKFLT